MPIPACLDEVFLPKYPIEILEAKENNKVPLIIGLNEQEYGWVVQQVAQSPSSQATSIHRDL